MGGLVSREEEGEEEGSRGEAGDEMRQRLQAGFKRTVFACKWYVQGGGGLSSLGKMHF